MGEKPPDEESGARAPVVACIIVQNESSGRAKLFGRSTEEVQRINSHHELASEAGTLETRTA
jgi:hypothetical protein